MAIRFQFDSATHTGLRRPANEDYAGNWPVPLGHLFVVCDGMGGHSGGAEAAEIAAEAMHKNIASTSIGNPFDALHTAVKTANDTLLQAVAETPALKGMGTTVVAAIVSKDKLYYAHIGDSRLYRLRGGELERLTRDHTLVQLLLDHGQITEAEAATHPHRHVIEKALGSHGAVQPTLPEAPLEVEPGDLFVLCTDGLTNMLGDEALKTALLQTDQSLGQRCAELIAQANAAGGDDNITVQIFHFEAIAEESYSAAATMAPPQVAAAVQPSDVFPPTAEAALLPPSVSEGAKPTAAPAQNLVTERPSLPANKATPATEKKPDAHQPKPRSRVPRGAWIAILLSLGTVLYLSTRSNDGSDGNAEYRGSKSGVGRVIEAPDLPSPTEEQVQSTELQPYNAPPGSTSSTTASPAEADSVAASTEADNTMVTSTADTTMRAADN